MPTYIGRKKNPFFPIKAINIGSNELYVDKDGHYGIPFCLNESFNVGVTEYNYKWVWYDEQKCVWNLAGVDPNFSIAKTPTGITITGGLDT